MARLLPASLGVMLVFVSTSVALAQRGPGYGENLPVKALPDFSSDLVDPAGLSRFHLVTRASFSDGNSVFSSSSFWSFEARAHLRVSDGLALSAILPFGFVDAKGEPNKFFIGNVTAGIGGGGRILLTNEPNPNEAAPVFRIGGALDVYAPTSAKPSADNPFLLTAQLAIANLHAYEPYLYIPNMMAFRGRAHADLTVGMFTGAVELGLAPAFTLNSSSDFLLWFSAAGRIAVHPTDSFEGFLEMGTALQIVGPGISLDNLGDTGKISPPLLLTPGVRFHFYGIDPAFFASFNFVHASGIIFGVDLAGALRKSRADLSEDIFRGFGDQ